jgi:hypothetical protein
MDEGRDSRVRRGPLFTVAAAAVVFAALVTANMLSDDSEAPARPVAAQAPDLAKQPTAPAEPGAKPAKAARKQGKAADKGPFSGIATPRDADAEAPNDIRVYYGRTDDDTATVALVISGARASAYVCDSTNVEAWFDGPARGQELELTGTPGNKFWATIDGDAAAGYVRYSAGKVGFSVVAAEPTDWMLGYQGPVDDLTRSPNFTETALERTAW